MMDEETWTIESDDEELSDLVLPDASDIPPSVTPKGGDGLEMSIVMDEGASSQEQGRRQGSDDIGDPIEVCVTPPNGNQGDVIREKASGGFGFTSSMWEWRNKRRSRQNLHSYKQSKRRPDEIVSGKRKKRSALHGTGVSKWYQAKNWYYVLLDWSWSYLFVLITCGYLLTCLVWALITWGLADGIECEAGEDIFIFPSFGISAIFATSNIVTLGFGVCLPSNYGSYTLGCLQQYSGLLMSVIVLSVVVSKFQIPKPDIVFSKRALVTTRDGRPVLLIRIGNRRVNLLYETRVNIALLRPRTTFEGETYVEYLPLNVQFPPSLTAVATIIHEIDGKSPLLPILRDSEDLSGLALTVTFLGLDSVYNDELSCTTQYTLASGLIIGGVLFGDMMERVPNGKGMRANFDKFDTVKSARNSSMEDLNEALQNTWFEEDESEGDDDDQTIQITGKRQKKRASGGGKTDSKKIINDISGDVVVTKPPPGNDYAEGLVYLAHGNVVHHGYSVRVCPYSRIIYMFLKEAGIQFNCIDIDWNNKPKWFLETITSGKTPAIFLDGKWTNNTRDVLRRLTKHFPTQSKMITKRRHNLPVNAFEFYSMLEKLAFQVVFSPPDIVKQMLHSAPACSYIPSSKDTLHSAKWMQRKKMSKLQTERLWNTNPPPMNDAASFHVVIPVRRRGDTFVRFDSFTQTVELLLNHYKIQYVPVLIDVEAPTKPSWLTHEIPAIYANDKVIVNKEEILTSVSSDGMTREFFHEYEAILGAATCLCINRDDKSKANLMQMLQRFEDSLPDTDELNHTPYLNMGTSLDTRDMVFAPLFRWLKLGLLDPHCESFEFATNLPRLSRYICGMSRTAVFRDTALTDEPEPFYALITAEWLLENHHYETKTPLTKLLEEEQEASERVAQEVHYISVHEDGSLLFEGGLQGPNLEMNTLYLAVGCVPRGEELAKVCPYSRVVEMAALEAKIPSFHAIKVDLINKPKWFTSQSNGKCPSMYWNGAWIADSQVVLNNLKALFPQHYSTIDVPAHLDFEPVGTLKEMGLFNASDEICEAYLVAERDDPSLQAKKDKLMGLLSSIEKQLGENEYLTGSNPSMIDIALVCSVWRYVKVAITYFHDLSLEENGLHHLGKWFERFEQRESFIRSMPPMGDSFLRFYSAKFSGTPGNGLKLTEKLEKEEQSAIAKVKAENLQIRGHNLCVLSQLETLFHVLEDALKMSEGMYLCGKSMGLADILVFTSLWMYDQLMTELYAVTFTSRGFNVLNEYIRSISEKPRFREVISPAATSLLRIHFGARLSEDRPHLKLTSFEQDQLEMQAMAKMTKHPHRPTLHRGDRSSQSQTNSSAGSSEQLLKQNVDDLLFCI